MATEREPNPDAPPEWNFWLPDSDRNSGWSNHTYCLQYVCSGYGWTATLAWENAYDTKVIPDDFELPENLVAIRRGDEHPILAA